MNLFYAPEILNGINSLPEDEAKHCIKVLRHKVGETIHIIDGKGNKYTCSISEITKKTVDFDIVEKQEKFGYFPYLIRMFVAPTKNIDRFEFFVEKAVEMGVCEIHPIICDNSERKSLNLERIERIMISALKQSYKSRKPILFPLKTATEAIKTPFEGNKFIAHCNNAEKHSLREWEKPLKTNILIGPEGDFSAKEIELAQQNNWLEITLGNARLRTETAALTALSSVHFMHL